MRYLYTILETEEIVYYYVTKSVKSKWTMSKALSVILSSLS